ncbi:MULTISPECIES: tryptophan--tRNA ligase [Hyphomonas]|uniref:Tryptophan--tRNA ligase n=1 Tax=Hyphomonas adhaerens TaxID=81029 RepID=A0A3B9H1J4_9PROT|nr:MULTISPECIES: tryptophan--tRNA ligase [Hyphomonas]MBB39921.1 tryptophan--tRNA ligase [Hyphomonas sp.]HAE28565.1 tryptophan--tRNA ligase [Hyphomonas adhaerens]|tara:strand:- start:8778 stop:9818 length:1041 start_codon:yes stop_codon:yes gene_type:complete
MTDTNTSEYTGPQRVFSGIQPTGNLHLGNYLGALKKFVDLQNDGWDCVYSVVDMHAITMPVEKGVLADQTRQIAAAFIACGIDPKKSIVYAQASVPAHAELAWVFNCVARMGWVERMTQFKDKAGKDAERASVGLFTYPVLQAADILAYKATHVPVGEDQKQHLELSRDIADRFNREYDVPGFFPLPEPLIKGPGARIMSLKDGTKKMSKSDPSDLSRINLVDDADLIAKKIKKAKTDLEGDMPSEVKGLEGRPEVENLVGIYSAVSGQSVEEVLAEYGGKGFGVFKPALADVMVAHLAPITQRFRDILADQSGIDAILRDGAERANAIAAPIMEDVRRAVGYWRP